MRDKCLIEKMGIGKGYNKKWEHRYLKDKDANKLTWKSPNRYEGGSPSVSWDSGGGGNRMAPTSEKFCSGKKECNIFAPLCDSVIESVKVVPDVLNLAFKCSFKAFDCLGDIIYRIIEGKPYIGDYELEKLNSENMEKIQGRYEFVAPCEFELDTNVKYEHIEGDKMGLRACVGVDKAGDYAFIDALKGHMLIGATTEWGKSNLINVYLTNLIQTYTKNEFRYILCDYKQMDLIQFEKYEHCIGSCATNKKSFLAQVDYLEKICNDRIEYLRKHDYLSVKEINEDTNCKTKFPYILYIVDELPMVANDNKSLERLTDLMRLCRVGGIYVVLATQDARKKTIDSIRMLVSQVIGLHVATKTDSDTLLEGANLQDIQTKGRFKMFVGGELKEAQSFYLTSRQIKELLKKYKSNNDK